MNSNVQNEAISLNKEFGLAVSPSLSRSKKPAPFSIRLTFTERKYLKAQAGNQPLGAYIRNKLLDSEEVKRRSHRIPIGNEPLLAALLAELGKTHIASNLNQLARAANMGTFDASQDMEQLRDACEAVLAMRDMLIKALNLKA